MRLEDAEALTMTDDPLWCFALDLYARPGAAPACLALQDDAGADVTLVLYLLWCAATGRWLDAGTIAAADASLAPWRAAVVGPLRAARRAMKDAGLLPGIDTERCREWVKAAELEAERSALAALSAIAPAIAERRMGTAEQFLATYEAHLGQALPDEAVRALVDISMRSTPGRRETPR